MLSLKRRIVEVVLKLFSAITAALTPVRVAPRPVAVPAGRTRTHRIHK